MKHAQLIALALVLACAAVLVCVLVRETPPEEPARTQELAPAVVPGADPDLVALLSDPASTGDAAAPVSERAAAPAAETAFDVEDARWVSGTVALPPGCAADETLEVLALDERATYREVSRGLDMASWSAREGSQVKEHLLARRTVAGDGSFRLPFPAEQKTGHLMLRGRLLYLPKTVEVSLAAEDVAVVLEPESGTLIRGRLVAPTGTDGAAAELEGILVACRTEGDPTPTMGMSQTRISTRTKARADGSFEFRAMPVMHGYRITVLPDHLAATTVELQAPIACQVTPLDIPLETGGRIAGRVVDAAGEPVAEATVQALLSGAWFGFDDVEARETETDASGDFRLEAVPSGAVAVRANANGRIDSNKAKVEVPEAGAVEGLILELADGQAIAGTVVRADGTVAAGVKVEARFDPAYMAGPSAFNMLRGAKGETETDAEGRFRVSGLGGGPFVVSASEPPPGEEQPDEAAEGDDRKGWHTARRDAVRPETLDLHLVLHPPIGLHGLVVTGEDVPVTEFEITANRLVDGAFGETGIESRDESFEAADGRFLLEDLIEGRWKLHADAEGYVTPEPVVIALPAITETDPLVIRVVLAASIRGTVRSPVGEPVAGAEVSVAVGEPNWQTAISSGPKPPMVRSADDGTFELTGLEPGAIGISADAADYARGPIVNLELEPGEIAEEVEVTLTVGGTLSGLVYDKEGKPARGRMITINDVKQFNSRITTSDDEGEFLLEHVEPGTWQVIGMDRSADWAGGGSGTNMADMISSMEMTQASIVEGETTHVVLGAPPANPVTIHGKVTQGGEPYEGAIISFLPEGSKLYERMKFTDVGDDGLYEINVDGPGSYIVNVQQLSGGVGMQNTIEFSRDVPEGSEYKLDFLVPEGRVSGRVLGADGQPATGARITVVIDGGARSDGLLGGHYAEIQTDSEGAYDVSGLRPGTYRVSAGGTSFFGLATGKHNGRVTRGGLVVHENQWLQDVDFVLPEPGSIASTILDPEGNPAEGASLFVRDAEGRFLEPICFNLSDGTGRVVSTGLAPGEYSVVARTGSGASQELGPVRVESGEESEIDVRLEAGTMVWIRIKDRTGEDLRATVRVVDAEGREVGGMFSMRDLQELYMDSAFSPTEHRVGPVPAGKYRIYAETKDGLKAKKPVTLKGEPERKITIRLK